MCRIVLLVFIIVKDNDLFREDCVDLFITTTFQFFRHGHPVLDLAYNFGCIYAPIPHIISIIECTDVEPAQGIKLTRLKPTPKRIRRD